MEKALAAPGAQKAPAPGAQEARAPGAQRARAPGAQKARAYNRRAKSARLYVGFKQRRQQFDRSWDTTPNRRNTQTGMIFRRYTEPIKKLGAQRGARRAKAARPRPHVTEGVIQAEGPGDGMV